MTVHEYDIANLSCADCGSKIEARIQALPEVNSANLDFMNKKLVVEYQSQIENALDRLNKIAAAIDPEVVFSLKGTGPVSDASARFWIPLGLGTALLILAHFLAPPLTMVLSLIAYVLVAYRVLLGAVRSLGTKQVFSEKFLMSIATIGALILGEYLEAGAVMVLYEIGGWLEDRAVNHSRSAVKSMLSLKPEIAHLRSGEAVVDKRLAEIALNDVVLIYPGERIPLDGTVVKGESTVDTSSLTGEAEPLYVSAGTRVFAGFLNNSGLLEMRVDSLEAESTITRILNMIENATARKSPQEKFITRFARYYTPIVVLLALLVFLVPTLLGYGAAVWFKRSLVFLIVSCPCALVISIPLTYFVSIGIAAKKGIILKGSTFLDTLRKVDTVVFDKTGTLTTGKLEIEKLYVQAGQVQDELMNTLFLCEYTSSHPFATAIKSAFPGVYESSKVGAYSEYPGKGVLVEYAGDRLIAGSEAFLQSYGFVGQIHTEASSVVHAAKNDFYLGCVTFTDQIKPEIREALSSLKELGISRNIMLSGDRFGKAEKVSQELGLDAFYAELLPGQKLAKLEEIMQQSGNKIAYVGDGMNDAPSLARADVGIAMGKIGNQVSIESADIVLLNDHPRQLAEIFRISQRTGQVVKQNIAFALGVKILVMSLGVSGVSGLWEAIIADVGVTLLVVFNSLRMLRSES